MTEKEKMLAGELYLAFDGELVEERNQAKSLCYELNLLHPEEDLRAEVLAELLPNSLDPWIEPSFFCDYGYNISTGKNFYANHGCVILDGAPVTIGDDVMFAPAVHISTATHPLNAKQRTDGLERALPVNIGDRVWIGMGANILPGVTIGDNAVIAAGAVVVKDVAPNTVVAGVPAQYVRDVPEQEDDV